MLHLILPILFGALFLIWFFYRVFVKGDIKKQKNSLYFGLFFLALWALIYYLIW